VSRRRTDSIIGFTTEALRTRRFTEQEEKRRRGEEGKRGRGEEGKRGKRRRRRKIEKRWVEDVGYRIEV